ncbi:hypothetical protein NLX83_24030 [Allokutzneria sp. A3M-2-11 16]|uniref:DddA-like double-stranded DNA deaminase toxin n=1 Tax=Allokutzneria sp. A3M-2-11 16 TaxID=2962043 RepID=UPI0020B73EC4|nr:DddA-like double-stranded DNA deaminase toxin [Allokutzneria sp. A3M-2-11 16]MCP3802344.1 hypothetical protein [Allokutzneria sp. A3M-2-11 16]
MSIRSEVVAAARRAVGDLPVALIDSAENALKETAQLWEHTTEGSPDSARDEVNLLLEDALDGLHAVRSMLGQLPDRVESWIAGLGGRINPAVVPPTSVPTPAALPPGVAAAFEDLSPLVRRQRGQTQMPTRGRILDAEGTIIGALRSGTDETTSTADRLIADAGFRRLNIAVHVELKTLVWMRANRRQHTTIVIDNEPCPGPYGCDKVMPKLLRPGESLTIYGPEGYRKTFRRMTQ